MCVNCISSRLYSYLNCRNFFFTPPPAPLPHNYKEMILIFQLKKYHCLHKRSPVLLRKFKTAINSVKKIEIWFSILSLSFVQVRKSHETQENTWMVVLVLYKSIRCALYGYKSTAMKWEYSDWCGYLVVNIILNKLTRTKTTARCISPIACI